MPLNSSKEIKKSRAIVAGVTGVKKGIVTRVTEVKEQRPFT